MFVFRRVTGDRFVHVGGVGRGEGWAGNIDLVLSDEKRAQQTVATMSPVGVRGEKPVQVFGPYYQREAVFVALSDDLIVVFGASEPGALAASNRAMLEEAAGSAAAGISRRFPRQNDSPTSSSYSTPSTASRRRTRCGSGT